ncbi:hypothetical protein CDO51_04355 [Natranaerobius trueperi]|uniref:dUTP diphosphatase n=1 Tax=Natranaerobius trueperi TaxID=759412 RepID=A0A226C1K3_9FIRM|nr:hypothetical protein CDO51_04355 [Natranaerobius trueperi]
MKVPLINLSKEQFKITTKMRIAQLVISKFTKVEVTLTEDLNETNRGTKGFGHTGI